MRRAYLYAIYDSSMQKKAALDKLSRLWAALRDALKELETTLEVAFERSALVKGNVYELAQIGRASCRERV